MKGSIEPGKLADFCILDKDIMTIDPHDLTDTAVLMTIVDGDIVYDNSLGAFTH
ncbi:MAG: amidohydrolase family protein [Gaiellales bacterium]|nr:amidohydrolase family protein [Gaiellales bacterium]